jgi:hypothetical protein
MRDDLTLCSTKLLAAVFPLDKYAELLKAAFVGTLVACCNVLRDVVCASGIELILARQDDPGERIPIA